MVYTDSQRLKQPPLVQTCPFSAIVIVVAYLIYRCIFFGTIKLILCKYGTQHHKWPKFVSSQFVELHEVASFSFVDAGIWTSYLGGYLCPYFIWKSISWGMQSSSMTVLGLVISSIADLQQRLHARWSTKHIPASNHLLGQRCHFVGPTLTNDFGAMSYCSLGRLGSMLVYRP